MVITWVDDSDPNWRTQYNNHAVQNTPPDKIRNYDAGVDRFRSWDNLEYVFRGIETYMPWVRTVHLVTNGQVPEWLNLSSTSLISLNIATIYPVNTSLHLIHTL